MHTEIGAIFGGMVLDVIREGVTLEKASIFREEAEQDTHKESLQVVTRVAAVFQRVMQLAEQFDGLDVDRVFIFELVLLISGNECEPIDVTVKISERKLDGRFVV